MRHDPLQQYAKLRQLLMAEKSQLETRLAELNKVLECETAPPSQASKLLVTHESPVARRGRKPKGSSAMSLREAVLKALAQGPLARKELVKAVEAVGYVFTTKNPLNSIGSVLYAKNGPIKNRGGKYYLPGGVESGTSNNSNVQKPAKRKKRRMSRAGRARIAAAARARWAKIKAGK